MAERDTFRVKVFVGKDKEREVTVSAPVEIYPVSVAKAVRNFSKDKAVQHALSGADEKCPVEVITLNHEVIGITVNACPDKLPLAA